MATMATLDNRKTLTYRDSLGHGLHDLQFLIAQVNVSGDDE